jgi:hypothetical protein
MRKALILTLTVLLSILLSCGLALAISGQCSNCHTMHNSQNGVGVVETYAGGVITSGVSTPQNQLLIASCIACHAGPTGETNLHGAPIVVHTTDPVSQGNGHTLAGGDFYWVATGLGATDSKGHNVSGLALTDVAISANIGNNPPGWDPNATLGFTFGQVASGEASWSSQLTCDGIYGCHGQHTASGVTGAHHNNPNISATQVTTDPLAGDIGGSYRFLGGIQGLENADWNWNETTSSHNEYFGWDSPSNRDLSNTAYVHTDTISFSCAECHGYFHSQIDSTTVGQSPWLRHPTDIMLPNKTEYVDYNPNVSTTPRTYSLEAPVARPSWPVSNSSQVTPGTDAVVMCLSCHRAHGSPEPDILRWTYSNMIAGPGNSPTPGTGCFVCHTTKD